MPASTERLQDMMACGSRLLCLTVCVTSPRERPGHLPRLRREKEKFIHFEG
jgi:hypothetical protein